MMEKVEPQEAAERLRRLQALQAAHTRERLAAQVGREVTVLVEGTSARDPGMRCGRTACNKTVNFTPGGGDGAIRSVHVTGAGTHSSSGKRGPPLPKEVTVAGVTVDPVTKSPIVVLREPESGNVVPIWIGLLEANAIALALEGTELPRPMTHDLMKSILHATGTRLRSVEIADIRESTTSPSSTSRGTARASASTRVPATPSPSPCDAERASWYPKRFSPNPPSPLSRSPKAARGTNGPNCSRRWTPSSSPSTRCKAPGRDETSRILIFEERPSPGRELRLNLLDHAVEFDFRDPAKENLETFDLSSYAAVVARSSPREPA